MKDKSRRARVGIHRSWIHAVQKIKGFQQSGTAAAGDCVRYKQPVRKMEQSSSLNRDLPSLGICYFWTCFSFFVQTLQILIGNLSFIIFRRMVYWKRTLTRKTFGRNRVKCFTSIHLEHFGTISWWQKKKNANFNSSIFIVYLEKNWGAHLIVRGYKHFWRVSDFANNNN